MNKMFESEEKIIERLEAAVEAEEAAAEEIGKTLAGGGLNVPESSADRRREILMIAASAVCTDRNLMYGEAEDNFAVIARFWETYLGMPVSRQMVADMMILFKVGRLATAERISRDTYVDIAGYAACAGGMIE